MAQRASKVSILIVAVLAIALLSFGVMAQDAPVTIKLWMHIHPPRIELDNTNIAQFEKDNPNIKVEYTTVPDGDWDTTLATALASGTGPDLFNQATFAMGQFYAQGNIVPVDPAAAGYTDQQSIYDSYEYGNSLLAGATFDGTLYGLPTELSTYACYANNALFKAAGLDATTDFPKTWEDMKTVAEKMTVRDSSGVLTQRGFDFPWGSSIYVSLVMNPMVEQLGGEMITEDYQAHINTPEVKQVMQYWNDWANTWKLGGSQYTADLDAFVAGQVGIVCSAGNWYVPGLVDAKIDYSIHPAPRWANARSDNGMANYAYFFMVNSQASPEVQAASWKLAGYLTSFPQDYMDKAALFQAKKSYIESDAFKANTVMPIFLTELGKSKYHARIAGFGEAFDALQRARDRVVTGGEDIDTVLADAQSEVQSILDNARASAGVIGVATAEVTP
jgi:ABC-type glycerol-3-phosphate transport system substrate-binding protein